jgi:hypothetical protein
MTSCATSLGQAAQGAQRGVHRLVERSMRLLAQESDKPGVVQIDRRLPERTRCTELPQGLIERRGQVEEEPRQTYILRDI